MEDNVRDKMDGFKYIKVSGKTVQKCNKKLNNRMRKLSGVSITDNS